VAAFCCDARAWPAIRKPHEAARFHHPARRRIGRSGDAGQCARACSRAHRRGAHGLRKIAEAKARTKAFEKGLESEGWSLGQNLRIEYRYAEGNSARMQALAKELVELKPGCILGQSTPVTAALMQATRTIPIVFVAVSDPIGSGFVASMARPGGNITGFTVLHASIAGKYLEMLKEMVPQLARVAIRIPCQMPALFFLVRSSSPRPS
jgi:hypothetical protein